ncbi:SDR family oxidoreductase [Embleya hyalina]|uniref:3-oxoacyl-ACP reductase n=1 Tax=Embleya hyalina TaxID=516124 RepID=A0A401YNG8_9ACTN|nr:SDR family oxidoreductase [Embleya hyalina]GCD96162.1 3-oxoacyl-ACP reductase [Embleya hyalina]
MKDTGTSAADDRSFDGRTAIVTGASRGIGRAIAAELVRRGARVCVTARDGDVLRQTVGELGPNVTIGVAGRVDDEGHQDEVVSRTLEAFGGIDFLVNNAGINPVHGPLMDLGLPAARKVVEVNALAPLAWTRKVHHAWMRRHGGAVVNISSIAALRPAENIGMYGASKAMLAHLTRQLALELAPRVRVNAVAPAVVTTSFASALYEGREAEAARPYPLRRLGHPTDVSAMVAFLLSERASWITGQVAVIDGGVTLVLPE